MLGGHGAHLVTTVWFAEVAHVHDDVSDSLLIVVIAVMALLALLALLAYLEPRKPRVERRGFRRRTRKRERPRVG